VQHVADVLGHRLRADPQRRPISSSDSTSVTKRSTSRSRGVRHLRSLNGSSASRLAASAVSLGSKTAAALVVFSLAAEHLVARKKKHRKKRCRRLHQTCLPSSGKPRCCTGLTRNDETFDPDVGACCRYHQAVCQSESQCCASFKCQLAVGLEGNRCCAPEGVFCEVHSDRCTSLVGSVFCADNHCLTSL
jgi:hypothetical protein